MGYNKKNNLERTRWGIEGRARKDRVDKAFLRLWCLSWNLKGEHEPDMQSHLDRPKKYEESHMDKSLVCLKKCNGMEMLAHAMVAIIW